MKQFPNKDSVVLVIKRGEELHTALRTYANEKGLQSAWLSGLGGSGVMTLGYYDIEARDYEWKKFSNPLEILHLQGNLSWVDGEPFWHIHGAFSDRNFQAVGGHVKGLVVGLTCELYITPLEAPLTRTFDDETGLKLLDTA